MIYRTFTIYSHRIYDSMVGIAPNTAFDGIHNITDNPFARPLRADGHRGEAGRHCRKGGRYTKRYADGRQKCKR
jgi:hypothetical protein